MGSIEVGQHHTLQATHGITTACNMRLHKQRADVANFERRYYQGFVDAYNFSNPDDEENDGDGDDDDDDEEEEEEDKAAVRERAPTDGCPR